MDKHFPFVCTDITRPVGVTRVSNGFPSCHYFVKTKQTSPLCVRQLMALAEAAEENRACLIRAFSRLRSATHLLILLLSLWQGLGSDQTALLESTLLPLLQDTPQLVRSPIWACARQHGTATPPQPTIMSRNL